MPSSSIYQNLNSLVSYLQSHLIPFEQRLKQELEENPALEGGKESLEDDFDDTFDNSSDDYDDNESINSEDINVDEYFMILSL